MLPGSIPGIPTTIVITKKIISLFTDSFRIINIKSLMLLFYKLTFAIIKSFNPKI